VSSHIFVFILYMIVAFGILNTIQMAVYEGIRELGIMLSIGTSPRRVMSMVMTESVFIALVGIAAGLVSGWLLSWYFTINPWDYSEYRDELEIYGMTTFVYYAKIKVNDFISCAFTVLGLTLIFTFFPARRAAKLDPVRAIKHL
ncbi:MAG TPA: FtsX-like permease family protein, partial [Spirochaetota bacterium]|nr:FtsX-like permease family protein [Spirochaetota bacterium]